MEEIATMRILFIDHECHRKTRSAEFFLDILRKSFAVKEHYYSHYYRTESAKEAVDSDAIVVWEFPISHRRFFFPGKKNVFVPMYDNEWGSFWQWKRIAWSGMGVISFCGKVSDHARRCGVENILDVRYFPDPAEFPHEEGNPKRVFLWERGDIDRSIAEKLFPPSEGYVFDVKRVDEFLARGDYLKRMSKCGIVIAPRRKEGIGMSFLEAMAMGKCVVACNDATMNEYIRNGENGILFHPDSPKPVSAAMISHVIKNANASVSEFRARWLIDKAKINAFIQDLHPCAQSFACRIKMALSYLLFLLEGVVHILMERLGKMANGK